MTTARRALPTRPTPLQHIAERLTSAQRHEALVSALEDQIDRLEGRARRMGPTNYYGQTSLLLAGELRRILQENS
jgi:hypothetical protein